MTDKKETKEISLPKVKLTGGNIRITGEELELGVRDKDIVDKGKDVNVRLKNPVIELPTDKELIEELIPTLWMLADVTNAKQGGLAGAETIKKLFKEYKNAYKEHKKE